MKPMTSLRARHLAFLTAAFAGLAVPAPLHAQQEPTTLRACFVPQVGAMYLLDLPGLPTECLSESHEEITWSDGGSTLADGSVTSGHLQDGAVTGDKLADGAVTAAGIAADAVFSSHIADNAVTASDLSSNAVTLDIQRVEANPPILLGGNVQSTRVLTCPSGYVVLSGGWDYDGSVDTDRLIVQDSYAAGNTMWSFSFYNGSAAPFSVTPEIVCARLVM